MKNKKIIAILTLLCFMFTLMPVTVFAEKVDSFQTISTNQSWNNQTIGPVTIEGGSESAPIIITVIGTVEVAGTITIKDNVLFQGNGMLIRKGANTVEEDDDFVGNMIKVDLGAIFNAKDITIDGGAKWVGEINSYLKRGRNNTGITVAPAGAAVLVPYSRDNDKPISINWDNVTLQNSATKEAGGNLYIGAPGKSTFNNCRFLNNYGGASAGTIWITTARGENDIQIFENCLFSGNEDIGNSHATGGAAIRVQNGDIIVNSCTFENNASFNKNYGGAIYINNGTINAQNSYFIKNYAQSGAAVRISESFSSVFRKCYFEENVSEIVGAVFCFAKGTHSIIECEFRNNKGRSDGNGAIIWAWSGTIIKDSVFDNNQDLNTEFKRYVAPGIGLAGSTVTQPILLGAVSVRIHDKLSGQPASIPLMIKSGADLESIAIDCSSNYQLTAKDIETFSPEDGYGLFWNSSQNKIYIFKAELDGGRFAKNTNYEADKLPEPVKDTYKFAGWYTDENLETPFSDSAGIRAGATYYAKWVDVSEGSEGTHIDHVVTPSSLDFETLAYGEQADSQTFELTAKIDDNYDDKVDTVGEKHIKDVKVVYPFEASYDENVVTVKLAEKVPVGTYNETVYVTTDDDTVLFVPVTLKVVKANLTITADDKTITVNEPLPSYTYSMAGLVDGDDLIAEPVINCQADGMTTGEYDIIISGADAGDNYNIQYVNGTLKVIEKVVEPEEDDTKPDTKPSTSTGGGFSGSYNYPVSTLQPENGSVTLSDNNASAGETVIVTVKPDNGYGVAEVIVTDEKGNVIPVSYLGNGEYSFVMPEGKVNIETICKPAITLTVGEQTANVFGKTITIDAAPIITEENRTMLPIRFITEALGGTVEWNEATQTVTITKDGVAVQIIIGADYAYINGEKVKLDSPAFIENGRTYLPVRFVSEALGAIVNWDAKTQQIVIMK